MIKRGLLAAALTGWVTVIAFAQAPRSYNSADILQQLQQLKVLGSVLYIGAHPDDENTRLLAFLAKERKYRTAYLSLTRGDGGQNLLGNEQGIELGLIRTQELLAARRIDGAEQFFSRAYDFGFSKSPQEALKIWGADSILSDVVWVIRTFRPDVIITRFPEDGRAGHGHHSASAILAREAFVAAADSTKFPEQLTGGVHTWQAKRILWNTYNFGGNNTTRDDQLKVDVGSYNEVLGKSYGEMAAESRSQHKSQGFGVASTRGHSTEYFQMVAGDPFSSDLMDGIMPDWSRVGAPSLNSTVDSIIATYNPQHPSASYVALERLASQISALPDGYWKAYKLPQVRQLENACSGLWLEAFVTTPYVVQGQTVTITVSMINRGVIPLTVLHISLGSIDTLINVLLPSNSTVNYTLPLHLPADMPLSQPYWLEQEKSEGRFTVTNPKYIGKPQNDPPLKAMVTIDQEGVRTMTLPVLYRYTDPVRGELYQPLEITPAMLVYFSPSTILDNVVPVYRPPLVVTLVAMKNIDARSLGITLSTKENHTTIDKGAVTLEKGKSYEFSIPYLESFMKTARGKTVEVSAAIDGTHYETGMKEIDYTHIPAIHYFHGTNTGVIGEQIKVSGKHIAYIDGAGDKMPACLGLMGYDVSMLGERDLSGDLSRFDAIVVGIRAFNTKAWLANALPVLMDYVKKGGVLLEQYNNYNGLVSTHLGPYPFQLSGGRVTDEQADVAFLEPGNSAFHFPNEITQQDFMGWIQERGLYFVDVPSTGGSGGLDSHYHALLAMKDPGEALQKGALIVTDYGKGKFVYTSLALFRQLPAGVPGAYRLMANLLAKRVGE